MASGSRRPACLGAAGALSLMLLGCGAAPPADAPPPLQGIVLVTIDTLRADHLGLHGGPSTTSPNLDALAADAVVFEQATAACPATGPAVATLLTGHHRATHGVRRNSQQITRGLATLPEVLADAGFYTVGAVANPVVKGPGFARGFAEFGIPPGIGPYGPGMYGGAPLVQRAAAVLDAVGERRFFLWLHLMDPHGPYFPPPPFRRRFDPEDYRWPDDDRVKPGGSNYGYDVIPKYQRVRGETDPAVYRARYDAEIRYTDALVGQIIALLRARNLWDRVAFVVTADHGEELGERRVYFQHGWHVYENGVHVPLIVRAPGRLPAARRVSGSVGTTDLMPTLLDLAGVDPPAGLEGRSLVPLVATPGRSRSAFSQNSYGNRLTALRHGRWKYIYTPPPPPARGPAVAGRVRDGRTGIWSHEFPTEEREELYDLVTDPDETRDLATSRPGITRRYRDKLRRWQHWQRERERARRLATTATRPSLPPELSRRLPWHRDLDSELRALGYLE